MVTIISLLAPIVIAVVLTVVLRRLLGTRVQESPIERAADLPREASVSPAGTAATAQEPQPVQARRVA